MKQRQWSGEGAWRKADLMSREWQTIELHVASAQCLASMAPPASMALTALPIVRFALATVPFCMGVYAAVKWIIIPRFVQNDCSAEFLNFSGAQAMSVLN